MNIKDPSFHSEWRSKNILNDKKSVIGEKSEEFKKILSHFVIKTNRAIHLARF